ncbi:hypothetical protein M422DRAFT_55293 [Sphaerobolus stellatus SS14]|uniref:Uncharacterized protein n=1 Tax=Sphaerobolus stellatus (strain SS14) TaxID=990650 RepID=A0A0C9UN62_SPHS4|nr:hypothetical protein M422DRAFT_55293 [Sphaerobolus stellatus SS14]
MYPLVFKLFVGLALLSIAGALSPILITPLPFKLIAITTSPEAFLLNDFDFIVVGGGTAVNQFILSSILNLLKPSWSNPGNCRGLSENAKYMIGIIDSGQYLRGDPLITTPANFGHMCLNQA